MGVCTSKTSLEINEPKPFSVNKSRKVSMGLDSDKFHENLCLTEGSEGSKLP